jgi:uncharacterized protein YqeY
VLNIREEYKQAMLNKNEDRKRVLGNLIAQMKNKEIELRAKNKELSDEDIISLIQKIIKQNTEANEMFAKGGRNDLIEQNNIEINILQEFLPKQLTDEEINDIIKSTIADVNAVSIKDMGKVIGQIRTKYAGQVDMSVVSSKIKEILG